MASVEFKEAVPGDTVVRSKAVYAIKAGPSDFDLFLCLRETTKSVRFTLTAPICISSKIHEAKEFEALIQDMNPLSIPDNYPRTHEWEVIGLVLGLGGGEATHFRAEYDSGTRKGSLEFLRNVPEEPIFEKSAKEKVEDIRRDLTALAKHHRDEAAIKPWPDLSSDQIEKIRRDLTAFCKKHGLDERATKQSVSIAISSITGKLEDPCPEPISTMPRGMYSKT